MYMMYTVSFPWRDIYTDMTATVLLLYILSDGLQNYTNKDIPNLGLHALSNIQH